MVTEPIGSMYGIFTYIWLIFMVNVGKYTIHGLLGESFVDLSYLTKLSNSNQAVQPLTTKPIHLLNYLSPIGSMYGIFT